MLLTIYNLPPNTRYNDIKSLIQSKCGFKEMILDNLASDGPNSKKVTIGLAEEEDAAILVRKINGYFLDGQQLFVETFKKKQPANQNNSFNQNAQQRKPLHSQPEGAMSQGSQQPNLQQPYYQQSSYQTPTLMAYAGMYGVADNQNAFANYGYPQQMAFQSVPQTMMQSYDAFDLGGAPLGFNDQGNNSSTWSNQNNWNPAANTSAWNKNSQEKSHSRWDKPEESRKRPNRDEPTRDNGREAPPRKRDLSSRDFGRDMSSRDFERDISSHDNGRDFGRNPPAREYGRDPSSRNFERNASPREYRQDRSHDHRKDASLRDRGRDASARDFERDAPSRGRARDAPARDRGRDTNVRDYGRNSPVRDQERNSPFFRRNERNQPNKKNSPFGESKRNTTTSYKMYGEHVTDPFTQENKFSQQRTGSKRFQPRPLPQPEKKPLTKRQRVDVNFGIKSEGPPIKSKKKNNKFLHDNIVARAETWRGQAGSLLAKEMMNNDELKKQYLNDVIDPIRFLKVLKRALRSRFETVLGDNNYIAMEHMAEIYRTTYDTSTDVELFKEVIETMKKHDVEKETERALKRENQEKDDQAPETTDPPEKSPVAAGKAAVPPGKAPVPAGKPATSSVKPSAPKAKPPGKGIPPKPFVVTGTSENSKNIPSYPKGDKKLSQAQKKENAMIFEDENILVSRLRPEYRTELEAEIEIIRKVVEEELQEQPAPALKTFHEQVTTTVLNDLLKTIKINYAKRILNHGPVTVRIFCEPKVVSRGKLAPILATYGVTSLRKSAKNKALYIGTCASFKIQDKLCDMTPLVVEGSTILIKPFQLAGMPEKFSKKKLREQREQLMYSCLNMPPISKDNNGEKGGECNEEVEGEFENTNVGDEGNYQDNDDEEAMNQENIHQEGDETAETIENENNEELNSNNDDQTETNNVEKVTNEDMKTDENEGETVEQNDTEQEKNEKEDNTKIVMTSVKPVENSENVNEPDEEPIAEDTDFAADVDISKELKSNGEDTFEIADDSTEHIDNENTNLNEEETEDFRTNMDDIDIADLNDDDLEDW